ncbi:MAG: hypothetical protein ACI8RZ_004728 [Myxococcota bacterium]|jgi:hypothetical protein
MASPNEKSLLGHTERTALAYLAALASPAPTAPRTHLAIAAFLHRSDAVKRKARSALKGTMSPADYKALARRLSSEKQKNLRRYPGSGASAWLEELEALGMDLAIMAPIIRTRLKAGDRLCLERGYIDGATFLKRYVKGDTLAIPSDALGAIPPEIGAMTHLRRLDVQGCGLTALPVEVGNLTNLEFIDLKSNRITEIPFDLGAMPRLHTLNLNGNPLESLPEGLMELPGLRRLFLSGPCIQTPAFDDIGELSTLEELGLFGTDRTDLPPGMAGLPALRDLMLFQTKIAAIPDLPALRRLHISFTPVRTIPVAMGARGLSLSLMATGMSSRQREAIRAHFQDVSFF